MCGDLELKNFCDGLEEVREAFADEQKGDQLEKICKNAKTNTIYYYYYYYFFARIK